MNIYSILPRNVKYPTGQKSRINAFKREVMRRTRKAYTRVIASLDTLMPSSLVINYQYEADPARMSQINAFIQTILNEEIYGNQQGAWSEGWWANAYASGAYEQGTNQTLQQSQVLVADAGLITTYPQLQMMAAQSVAMESGFQARLKGVYGRVFNGVNGFTDEQKKMLTDTITKGMLNGKSPRIIAKEISAKTGAIEWRALRLAATEMNTAFNNATMDETDTLNRDVFDDGEYKMMVMHISALLATTRADHGARHGTICTPEQQREWWETKAVGGRINCHCSTVDVLVNKKTGLPLQKALVSKVAEQKKEFFGG